MRLRILFAGFVAWSVAYPAMAANKPAQPATVSYGTITLPAGYTGYWGPGLWNLNIGTVTVSYTLDLHGAPNVAYTNDYSMAGYVGLLFPNSPNNGARMSGFLVDWARSGEQFPTYPRPDPQTQNLDDKFNLQRFPNSGSWDEQMYDVNCASNTVGPPAFNPWANYGIWFDRDGVDPYQAAGWGMVNGGTYNTKGVYDVRLAFRKASASQGTACPVFFPTLANPSDPSGFGIRTGFYNPNFHSGAPDFFPAGISFDTDETKMATMQVRLSGASGPGTIIVKNLIVSGYLDADSGKGLCKDGGWKSLFVNPTFKNQGQCVSYFMSTNP